MTELFREEQKKYYNQTYVLVRPYTAKKDGTMTVLRGMTQERSINCRIDELPEGDTVVVCELSIVSKSTQDMLDAGIKFFRNMAGYPK